MWPILLLSRFAYAEVTVEWGPFPDRAAAETAARAPALQSVEARVVRRYEIGHGWRYVVRSEVADGRAARALAAKVPGVPHSILGDPDAPPTQAVAIDADGSDAQKEAARLLDKATRAHGGRGGGLGALHEATSVVFVFTREITMDGSSLRAQHRYVRSLDGVRLDVDVVEGNGVDSVTVVDAVGRAWLATPEVSDQDRATVQDMLDRFAPEAILAVPLGLAEDVQDARAWRRLVVDRADDDGVLLVPAPDAVDALVDARFGTDDHLLVEVHWATEGDEVVGLRFFDYHNFDEGLVVPMRIEIWRGARLFETIVVEELRLNAIIPASIYTPEGPQPRVDTHPIGG